MTLNKTRKNLRDKISNKKNQCNTYSEGFIRRMTDDITFVKYIGPQKEHDRITEKFKKTCLKKFGVENASQNIDVYNKGLMTRLLRKRYKDTNLYYQASYELDFLDKYYDIIKDLENGPSIKYKYKRKNKVYHSDFYISFLNLVVEIKSSYFYNEIVDTLKKQATISSGYNYIMILDKDYKEFELLIKNKNCICQINE